MRGFLSGEGTAAKEAETARLRIGYGFEARPYQPSNRSQALDASAATAHGL
jgi:hypothetical protein